MKTKFKLIIFGFVFIFLAMLCNSAVALDLPYNVSYLPYSAFYLLNLQIPLEDVPDIVTAKYDGWLSGAASFDFPNITMQKTNISILLPANLSDGTYTRYADFNSSHGRYLRLGFVFVVAVNKTPAATNISVGQFNCDYSKNPPECKFTISAIGQEPKQEIITKYNVTPVTSCSDLYAKDYTELWNEKRNLQIEFDVLKDKYDNFTKILYQGCVNEQLAFDNCYLQKSQQERISGQRMSENFCVYPFTKLSDCKFQREVMINQAIVNLPVVLQKWKTFTYILLGVLAIYFVLNLGLKDVILEVFD